MRTMTPSLPHYVSLHNFHALRPTAGATLRIAVDIGSIWVAFLASWLLVDSRDLAALISPGVNAACSAGRAVFDLGLRRLHRCGPLHCARSYTLAMKLGRISLDQPRPGRDRRCRAGAFRATISPVSPRIVGDFHRFDLLLGLARVVSVVLRSEDTEANAGGREEPDPKKFLSLAARAISAPLWSRRC